MSNEQPIPRTRVRVFSLDIVKWVSGFIFAYATSVVAAPVSFNNFYYDLGAPVTVSADGSTATLAESVDFNVVLLSNIPALGNPEIIIAQPGARLQFNYQFNQPSGNADVFHAALLDGNSGASLGSAFEFFSSNSSAGQVQFNLSSLVGTTLGLQFELTPEFSDTALASTLSLSNLQIVPIPLPGAGVLMLSGMLLFSSLTTLGKKACCHVSSKLSI